MYSIQVYSDNAPNNGTKSGKLEGKNPGNCITFLKGTVTRDLIWLKVVSLDRSWLVGLTDDL